MTHSLLRPDRRPAGEGHTASADPSAGLYSVLPNPSSRDGTDSPVQSSSTGSGTLSDPRLYLPCAATSALRAGDRPTPPFIQTDRDREEDLRRVFRYEPESGHIVRRMRLSKRSPAGSVAGCVNFEGYVVVIRLGRSYRAHRLAWFLYHGEWPSEFIDHVNMIRSDNRICNLREASASQNMANRVVRKDASFPKGVKKKDGKFYPVVKHNKVTYTGPGFNNAHDAGLHYLKMARELHGEFARSDIDPAFFEAWRETQGRPADADPLTAQYSMGIR